ncbi:MAG: hypothetical protein FWD36_03930 [Treponema sp.]|nr:hypothetical protein [Treponema sp.]
MKRYRLYLLLLPVALACLCVAVCKSQPPAEKTPVTASSPEETETIEANDTINVSRELYEKTLAEVRVFVDQLNTLISRRDYSGWREALSEERLALISSQEFLAAASDSAVLRAQRITLRTPNDYFLHVVVPSRSTSRVDEIEFVTLDRVKVFYDNVTPTETRRLRLYELIKIEDTWKIID